jgi:hypothetical protein
MPEICPDRGTGDRGGGRNTKPVSCVPSLIPLSNPLTGPLMRRLLPAAFLLLAAPVAAQTWRPAAPGAAAPSARLGFASDVAVQGSELFAGRTGVVAVLPAPPAHPGAVVIFRRNADGSYTETGSVTGDLSTSNTGSWVTSSRVLPTDFSVTRWPTANAD